MNVSEKNSKIRIILWSWGIAAVLLLTAIAVYICFRPVTARFVDVGQGDCCFIQAGIHGNVLIDGGDEGSGAVIQDFLAYHNVRRLNGVFISHFHEDHVKGVIELLKADFPVDCVYISDLDTENELKQSVLRWCKMSKIPVKKLAAGDALTIGKAKYSVLWPEGEASVLSENNRSMVVKVSYGKSDILFTGDIEKVSCQELSCKDYADFEAEVLKIPHHGGASSADGDFIKKCNPDFAVISAGVDNMYGMPSDEALACLAELGIKTLRTDRDGVIDITLGKDGIKNITHGSKWRQTA